MGTYFLTQASNKRSITLDLKTERDREILKELVKTADVFVENYRPGAFEALGLGYDDLAKINPRLIYASFSAFGHGGPRGNADRLRPCHPGHLRHHGGDRHQGRQPDQARRAGGRLLDRHHRRLRALGGAVPARAHRQGPAHRHGDAGRGDDPDGLAHDRISAQRRRAEAARQPPSARHQRRVHDQGRRAGDDRREQHAPAAPACGRCSGAPT